MNFTKIFDIAVQAQQFRNIGLCYQGLYHLKFTLQFIIDASLNDYQKFYAHPYNILEKTTHSSQGLSDQFLSAHVIEKDSAFCTRSFLIRFVTDKIDMNDIGFFRMELKESENYNVEVYLEVELRYADMSDLATFNDGKWVKKVNNSNEIKFGILQKKRYRIHKFDDNVHEFMPVLFDKFNFCLGDSTIHIQLLDIRQQEISHQQSELPQSITTEKSTIQSDTQSKHSQFSQKSLTNRPFKSYDSKNLNQLHRSFVNPLQKSHQHIRKHFLLRFKELRKMNLASKYQKLSVLPKEFIYPEYIIKNNLYGKNTNQKAYDKNVQQKNVDQLKFTDLIVNHQEKKVCEAISNEVSFISQQTLQIWHRFIKLLLVYPRIILKRYKKNYNDQITRKYEKALAREVIPVKNLSVTIPNNVRERHITLAQEMRQQLIKESEPMNVEQEFLFPKPENHPILFEEVFVQDDGEDGYKKIIEQEPIGKDSNNQQKTFYKKYIGVHLIVLVHGLQATHFDMGIIKSLLQYKFPYCIFLSSVENENKTEGCIDEMGKRLAEEVKNKLNDIQLLKTVARISFIGHSLGGIIIRAALPYLQQYSAKMYTFMTFSSPHLGFLYHDDMLFQTGLSIFSQFDKTQVIKQLTFNDHKEMKQTFLYKLTQRKGLQWFQNILLVNSLQDNYAPFNSARIQISKKALDDKQYGRDYQQMNINILQGLRTKIIYRVDVNFNIPMKSLDAFIGRAAHMMFIEQQTVMRMILYRYSHFFSPFSHRAQAVQ